MDKRECIIIGAGPCGLSAAVEMKKRGISPLILEKGCVVNSIFGFPTFMSFFSTPELLEIGGIPFITQAEKPTRLEALKYYRSIVNVYDLDVRQYETVTDLQSSHNGFTVETEKQNSKKQQYMAERVVVATGYFDHPNSLGVPGEALPHVHHYFKEAHPHFGQNVVVVGGKNSAVEAAMTLQQAGANVTMVYRRSSFTKSVKAWVKPVIESAIEKDLIGMYWDAHVKQILPDKVIIEQRSNRIELASDVVYALIGYHPNTTFIENIGVVVNPETGVPHHDPDTMETNIPGLYIAGVMSAGLDANSIFIENGRFHGGAIAEHVSRQTVGSKL